MSRPLDSIARCFDNTVPSVLATRGPDGFPNMIALSKVTYVDSHHIVLSRQFFKKTGRNLAFDPRACLLLTDPETYRPYRLQLTFLRSETEGPLFEQLSAEIDGIASLTGMSSVFRLKSADVFRVDEWEEIPGFLVAP